MVNDPRRSLNFSAHNNCDNLGKLKIKWISPQAIENTQYKKTEKNTKILRN